MNRKRATVTIRDIAREAGLSPATVSRVLSGNPHTTEQTKKRVLEVGARLGYRPNLAARTMASNRSGVIGLVMDNTISTYTAEIIKYVERAVRQAGYELMLGGTDSDPKREERIISQFLCRQVDGLIIKSGCEGYSEELVRQLKQTPTVLIGSSEKLHQCSAVYVDNFHGGVIGTRYLCELGHRNIVFFGRRASSRSQCSRAEGYLQVCREYGMRPQLYDNPDAVNTIERSCALAKQFLKSGNLPSAVFAASDTCALGLMQAADTLGIRIPKDLSLLGFNNLPTSALSRIGLTTLDQPKEEIAMLAVENLLRQIERGEGAGEKRILLPGLLIRSSCAGI